MEEGAVEEGAVEEGAVEEGAVEEGAGADEGYTIIWLSLRYSRGV